MRTWVAYLLIVGSALTGCVNRPFTCPRGEVAVCYSGSSCRCGPACTSSSSCRGSDQCATTACAPSGAGACVDPLWLVNAPCRPVCCPDQICVDWGDRPTSCANGCMQHSDCDSRCCIPLEDGRGVCGPADICQNSCIPGCSNNELCVRFASPTCARTCSNASDCSSGCCVPLQGGDSVCAPDASYCMDRPPTCAQLDACIVSQTQRTTQPEGMCSMGIVAGSLTNGCVQNASCLVCWWSPMTGRYSDCFATGDVPRGATIPLGEPRCGSSTFPMTAVKVVCVDADAQPVGGDCLGTGPL